MDHPVITAIERFGSPVPEKPAAKIDECLYCGADIFDDNYEAVESTDGSFCDADCCNEYYEIRKIFD